MCGVARVGGAPRVQMAKLPGFSCGGTIHIVCNNQLGYTTSPTSSRSTEHASDLGRAFEAPVLHVNADDVESETRAAPPLRGRM